MVVEKYLGLIRQKTRLLVSSGNHDGDSRSAADESVAQWIQESRADGLFVDGDSLELPGALVTICPWWDGPSSRANWRRCLRTRRKKFAANGFGFITRRRRVRRFAGRGKNSAAMMFCWNGFSVSSLTWFSAGISTIRLFTRRARGGSHRQDVGVQSRQADRLVASYIAIDLDAMSAEWISMEGQSVRQLAVE